MTVLPKQPSAAQRSERRRTMSRLGSGLYLRSLEIRTYRVFLSDGVVMVDPPNSIPIMWTIVLGRADWCCGICHTPRLNRKTLPQEDRPEDAFQHIQCHSHRSIPGTIQASAPAPQGFEAARTLRAKA